MCVRNKLKDLILEIEHEHVQLAVTLLKVRSGQNIEIK